MDKLPIISPNNTLKSFMNLWVLAMNLVEVFYIPISFSFHVESPESFVIFQILIYATLLIDMLLSFCTGYYSGGNLIMSRKEIFQNYLKNDFFIDLITVLPVICLEYADPIPPLANLVKYVFLLRILYLDKMLRKVWDFYSSAKLTNHMISLFKLVIWIFFMAHIFACSMYKLSDEEDKSQKLIVMINEGNDSFFTQYIAILYWAFATMLTIGYGDQNSQTKNEKIFNILTMLITCCVFVSIMNKIGEMIDEIKNQKKVLDEKIWIVSKYLDCKTKDPQLKLRVRNYLEYVLAEKHQMFQEGQEIVATLSNTLKMEIFQIINTEIINKVSILKNNFSWGFLCSLASSLSEVSYTPEDFIIKVKFFMYF